MLVTTCTPEQFTCNNSQCITLEKVCDFKPDCQTVVVAEECHAPPEAAHRTVVLNFLTTTPPRGICASVSGHLPRVTLTLSVLDFRPVWGGQPGQHLGKLQAGPDVGAKCGYPCCSSGHLVGPFVAKQACKAGTPACMCPRMVVMRFMLSLGLGCCSTCRVECVCDHCTLTAPPSLRCSRHLPKP
ncbi:hypothetical protein E2C01_041700 [Portunus trituberculatus]|uniref:Uncharacterized protein n=1 Tax=Portunus trituberculatus TaxID=210409 RepID=A0A5B7FRQ3_PORTR|nr:hypothetical protein [Portunus trituberculatus]